MTNDAEAPSEADGGILYDAGRVALYFGDCLSVLQQLPDASVDAVVTDPPYGLSQLSSETIMTALTAWFTGDRAHVPDGSGFMGKAWDAFVPPPAVWDECFRVLKPGGHLLAFAGSRTYDLMGLSIRLAGFEIRDGVAWLNGQGFPKSLDVSKAIDKAAGAAREVIGIKVNTYDGANRNPAKHGNPADQANIGKWGLTQTPHGMPETAPATDEAKKWAGWGTALKPAFEPVVVARKPVEGTVAANVLKHGTGAINIDGTRTPHVTVGDGSLALNPHLRTHINGGNGGNIIRTEADRRVVIPNPEGRFPANVVLDESQASILDLQSGITKSNVRPPTGKAILDPKAGWNANSMTDTTQRGFADEGGASRFFYVAKASKRERPEVGGVQHPTVKPLTLMRWLVRLVTPENGLVIDPFAGSGTTVEAAILEGMRVIGIEREPDYLPLIQQRIARSLDPTDQQNGHHSPTPEVDAPEGNPPTAEGQPTLFQ